ncbi:DNA breaking-rejoining enzyme, partial [Mycena galopus ATCC 62051]
RCDTVDINNIPVPKNKQILSYGTVQKMRAAITYYFGTFLGRGQTPWNAETKVGNPCMSNIVADYFPSLRRRKVAAGERSISSQALTDEDLNKIYNHHMTIETYKGTWGSKIARLQAHSMATMGEALLLRSDEVLQIKMENMEFQLDKDGNKTKIKIVLEKRKNDQFGSETKPFWIHLQPEQRAHRCAFRAVCAYIHASRVTSGYLYRLVTKAGQVSRTDKPLSGQKFLTMLRHSLLDVGVDPISYGTHCLRRGGAQYLYREMRVNIVELAHWGGWAGHETSDSMWRYLVGLVDDGQFDREQFGDPNRPPEIKCWTCGRSCSC